MKTTTFPKEERFQSSGQLQRPFTIASTPLPVMSGAMAASSMRYGHWDTNLFMISPMQRCSNSSLPLYNYSVNCMISLSSYSGYAEGDLRLSPPSTSWLSQEHLSADDQMLVGMHVSMHACSVIPKFTSLEFCSTIQWNL